MKHVVIGICLLLVAGVSLLPGRAQEASQSAEEATNNNSQAGTKNWAAGNPLKIAQLKWYQANQTTSFNVGKTKNSNPYGLAFDGQNMWSANSAEGTVSKLRASDGKTLGTFNVPCCPYGLAFDGANIWVTLDGGLMELRASNGASLGSFFAFPGSTGVAFDGANIWVALGLDHVVLKF